MITDWTPETLANFEADIAASFNRGEIKAPVHLAAGNEKRLINIFKKIQPQDWVIGTWRSHYHCLLKGVPALDLKDAIKAGRSIALCFPEQRVLCSALVGGAVPLALGLAWAAKRNGTGEKVFCFIGDMAACTGIVSESARYAAGHKLPLRIVVEDNGLSVATDTLKSWGGVEGEEVADLRYSYTLSWPHVGTGTWVHMQ